MSDDKSHWFLATMEDAMKTSLKYCRVASFLFALEIVLLVMATIAVVMYFLIGGWQPAVAGATLSVVSIVAGRLHSRYHYKTFKEVNRLKRLMHVAALYVELDLLLVKVEKEVEELEQLLRNVEKRRETR